MAVNYFCLRYVLLGCFVILGVSGVVVCTAGSIFVYQLREKNYSVTLIDNLEGSPATMLVMGLLTSILAIYFWFVMDYKYNRPQFIMFTLMLLLISIIEGCVGVWALVKHEQLDTILTTSLQETLDLTKINYMNLTLNYTQVQPDCCGYNETVMELDVNIQSCCDFTRLNNETKIICEVIHGTECRHLIINKNRSILLHVFLLALCSIILQILINISIIYYAKYLKKQKTIRLQRSTQDVKPTAP